MSQSMSQSMGNIVNRPILAVPVRLAAVAAFAVTLTDRRKGSPARADPYPERENSAAGNFGLRARRGIFWYLILSMQSGNQFQVVSVY